MKQNQRTIVVVVALVAIGIALAVLGYVRSQRQASSQTPEEGMIHIYVDGTFAANVSPATVSDLPTYSFQDAEQGKTQEGPSLEDVLSAHIAKRSLGAGTTVTVNGVRSQGSEPKETTVTWEQIVDPESHLILDVAGSGDSLKLVSTLPGLDTRDTWVQGVQRIDIQSGN